MGTEGIEPPADGLEPPILPLNYAPLQNPRRISFKPFLSKLFYTIFFFSLYENNTIRYKFYPYFLERKD